MLIEAISSFALNVAAGVAIEMYKSSNIGVKQEIEKAFQDSLRRWSRNESIREHKAREFRNMIKVSLDNPQLLLEDTNDVELRGFLLLFKEELCKNQTAYNYLEEIKDREQYNIQISHLTKIEDRIEDMHLLLKQISDNLPKSSTDLESEWNRQIKLCRNALESLKPITALTILKDLEKSIIENETNPKSIILSAIEFLKAQCEELVGNQDQANLSYIKAYKLNSDSILFKEKACSAYFSLKMHNEVNILIDEIFQKEDFNPTAWLFKIILSDNRDLLETLSQVPEVVINNPHFKASLYYKAQLSDFANVKEAFQKYSIVSDLKEIIGVNYSNLKECIFLIECTFQDFAMNLYFDFNHGSYSDIDKLERTNNILGSFISSIQETELFVQFKIVKFYFSYTSFLLTSKKEIVFDLYNLFFEIFDTLNDYNQKETLILMTANPLQLIKEEEKALDIIGYDETSEFILTLKAHILYKLKRYDEFAQTQFVIIDKTELIDGFSADNLLTSIVQLDELNRFSDKNFLQIFTDKEYSDISLKTLVLSIVKFFQDGIESVNIQEVKEMEQKILDLPGNSKFFIGYLYFLLERYSDCVAYFNKYLDLNTIKATRDLHLLILALEKEANNHVKLLELLKFWRLKLPFDNSFLRMEADLCRKIPDWERCLDICNYYLNYNLDESFLVLKLTSINELDLPDKNSQIKELAEVFAQHEFSNLQHLKIVNKILLENEHYAVALENIYKLAINKDDGNARTEYFMTCIRMPEGLIEDKEIVEIGCYVKYILNDDQIKFTEILPEGKLTQELLGHKINDKIVVTRPLVRTKDNIVILRIMDKYLSLHDQICQDVADNPYGGLPFQSVKFEDMSPEGMRKTLIECFGEDGSEILQIKNEILNKYYRAENSLTEVILNVYSLDYIGGFFDLIEHQNGILIPPIWIYNQDVQLKSKRLIIDISALLILYEISTKTNIKYDNELIIANSLLAIIKQNLSKQRNIKKDEMSMSVTKDTVTPIKMTFDNIQKNIAYLESLLAWINEKCKIVNCIHKLDILNNFKNDDISTNPLVIMMVENISLLDELNDSILITDDSFYLKVLSKDKSNCFTTEFCLSRIVADTDMFKQVLTQFKYKGIDLKIDYIIGEYNKKLQNKSNYYTNSIFNLNFRYFPSVQNAYKILTLIFEIIKTSHETDKDITDLFEAVFQGINFPNPYRLIAQIILENFSNNIQVLLLDRLNDIYLKNCEI